MVSVSRAVDAFFCPYCIDLQIAGLQFSCSKLACECAEPFELTTILDLYAMLYYHLDNRNLIEYETLMTDGANRFWAIHRRLQNRWKAHTRPTPYLYKKMTQRKLRPETTALLRTTMEASTNGTDLLLTAMSWLFILDEALADLRDEWRLRHEGDIVIPTVRGPLLYKCDSPFLPFLAEYSEFRLPVDPNYLTLQKKVQTFYLIKASYPYYSVTHRYLPLPPPGAGDVSDWKLGFIPGKFKISFDYRYIISNEPNDDGMVPFSFDGLRDEAAYNKIVLEHAEDMINENPDVLMLPELMTPLPLQEALKQLLQQKARHRDSNGSPHRTALMLTGSFHVKHAELEKTARTSTRIYNYAQLVDGFGERIADVYKMNRFVLNRDESFEGELLRFRTDEGVETNAYDKREMILWETSWGRIAALICVDFLNANVAEILHDRQVDLIFVMTMTPSPAGGKFIRRMQEFGERNHAMIIACNHLGVDHADERGREERVVVYLPGFKKTFIASNAAGVYRLGDIAAQLNQESARQSKKP